jgi:hypothetical protein
VINYLERTYIHDDNVALAFIYFNYKEQQKEQQNLADLIGSLLQQILLRQTNISDEVRALFERHSLQKTRPTVGQLSTLLQSESRPLSKFFIVIDALDECHSDKTACNLLEDLQTLGPAMRLLVTARPHIISVKQRYEDAVV